MKKFAEDVLERFNNPFVDHAVTSIMLNSFPKFETRDLPGLKTYLQRKGELPKGLVLGLAAIITYYKGGVREDGAEIVPNDAPEIMQLLKDLWATGDTQKVAGEAAASPFFILPTPPAHASLAFAGILVCSAAQNKCSGSDSNYRTVFNANTVFIA